MSYKGRVLGATGCAKAEHLRTLAARKVSISDRKVYLRSAIALCHTSPKGCLVPKEVPKETSPWTMPRRVVRPNLHRQRSETVR